jgi:hypothetical protein
MGCKTAPTEPRPKPRYGEIHMEMNPAENAALDTGAAAPATPNTNPDTAPEQNPTSQPTTPPAQPDVTQTQAFAKRLREATEKARQEAIAETEARYKPKLDSLARYAYGEHGIRSFDDIAAQIEDYEYQQRYGENVSREAIEKAVSEKLETHPDIQAARAFNQMRAIENAAASLAKSAPELSITDSESLCAYLDENPDVSEMVKNGWPADQAIWALKGPEITAKREAKVREAAQQDTIAKLQTNAVATPGPVGQGGANESEITFTDAQFNNPDQKRLVHDDRYYKAYMNELRRRTKG